MVHSSYIGRIHLDSHSLSTSHALSNRALGCVQYGSSWVWMADKRRASQHPTFPLALCQGCPPKQRHFPSSHSSPRLLTAARMTDLIYPVFLKWTHNRTRCCSTLTYKRYSSLNFKAKVSKHLCTLDLVDLKHVGPICIFVVFLLEVGMRMHAWPHHGKMILNK